MKMKTLEIEIAKKLVEVSGGPTPGRIARLVADMKQRNLPLSAYDIVECVDERTGVRFGNAECRRGFATKLGHTTYQYQVWAVVKSEYRK